MSDHVKPPLAEASSHPVFMGPPSLWLALGEDTNKILYINACRTQSEHLSTPNMPLMIISVHFMVKSR